MTKFFAWLFRVTRWRWALKWYGIYYALQDSEKKRTEEKRDERRE